MAPLWCRCMVKRNAHLLKVEVQCYIVHIIHMRLSRTKGRALCMSSSNQQLGYPMLKKGTKKCFPSWTRKYFVLQTFKSVKDLSKLTLFLCLIKVNYSIFYWHLKIYHCTLYSKSLDISYVVHPTMRGFSQFDPKKVHF